jgi:ribosomal protein L44E
MNIKATSFLRKCAEYVKKMNLDQNGAHRFKPRNVHRHGDHLDVKFTCAACNREHEAKVADIVGDTDG